MPVQDFLGDAPSLDEYWRGIILFGANAASYKFALAQSLLELAPGGKTLIALDELAEPYARHTLEHLRLCDSQSVQTKVPYPFLEACRQYNREEISYDQLIGITAKEGLKVVLDKFHNLNSSAIPTRFFTNERLGSRAKAIALTDELFRLLESNQAQNLPAEIESRWRLVETAWELGISRNLIAVGYDAEESLLFTQSNRRTNITSCRSALNGYQKGKCFYCFGEISIVSGAGDLTDVDHFFPYAIRNEIAQSVDGVWNLVLACVTCNRGSGGKFHRLPHQRFLERLHKRNEFFIDSHHPLGETIKLQTGKSKPHRRSCLTGNYNTAKTGRLINSIWQPVFEYSPAF
ncbi:MULTISPECIES: hypothetical protein [unclassified Microcoleus]|uniref:hypothetical protein n=1 Tax=unclassified Microcoleus TaxID=2642155 RepID=UPI002FD5D377